MDKVGKYVILGKLGQGGMGVVYKALDPLLDRVVALKTISTQLDAEPELRARFFREGRSAAHLSHKNIITIYDFGEDGGVAYLAMEYLEGEDLKAKISRRVNLSLGTKLGIVTQVCEGLAHAHSRQVIHRDIKPANVLVPGSGEAKILDFGLALMVAMDITRSGTRLGTPSYMSPEQVRGERVDHRTDIFSVGTLLYELLTLRKPFDDDSIPATIFKILQVEPEPPQAINPSIAPELGAIVMKALAKQREDRFQTIDELRAALLDVSSGLAASDLATDEEETTTCPDPIEAASSSADGARQEGKWGSDLQPGQDAVASAWTPTLSITPPSKLIGRDAKAPAPRAGAQVANRQALPALVFRILRRPLMYSFGLSLCAFLAFAAIWRLRHTGVVTSAPGAIQSGVGIGSSAQAASTAEGRDPKHVGDVAQPSAEAGIESSSAAKNPGARATAGPANARAPSGDEGTGFDRFGSDPKQGQMILRESRKAGPPLGEGRLKEAAPPLAEVSKVPPSNPEAGQPVMQGDAPAKTSAAQALNQMTDSKEKAVAAGAPQFAARSYEAARKMEEEARNLYDGGQFEQASARLYETSGLYASAALAADSEREARARAERRAEEGRQAAALDASGTRAPVPPDAMAKAAPAVTQETDRQAITSVLGQYAAALQARDIARLKAVWPGLGGKQEEALRNEFRNAREIQVQLLDIDLRISGDSAVATARRLYVLHTLDGKKLETDNRTAINLSKVSGTWLLERIGFESPR